MLGFPGVLERYAGNCKRGVRRVRGVSQRKFACLRLQLIGVKYSGFLGRSRSG